MRRNEGAYLTWHPTGAGIYAFSLSAMFVQVYDENGAILMPALPSHLRNLRFHGLLATDRVRVSGEVRDGKLVRLDLTSGKATAWRLRTPETLLSSAAFRRDLKVDGPDARGLVTVACRLESGVTPLPR
jgi:hypothetical protein